MDGDVVGEPLPDRVVRAIVLARLANFLDGHAAVRGLVAQAVAGMLDGDRLPAVAVQSNGGSGEVLALGSLFFALSTRVSLTAKERMALINGSPCAAALIADVALAGRGGSRSPSRCSRWWRRSVAYRTSISRSSSASCGETRTKRRPWIRCARSCTEAAGAASVTRRRCR